MRASRNFERIKAREAAAKALIGTLERDGRTIYYLNERDEGGLYTGRTVEFSSESRAIIFALRHSYT